MIGKHFDGHHTNMQRSSRTTLIGTLVELPKTIEVELALKAHKLELIEVSIVKYWWIR